RDFPRRQCAAFNSDSILRNIRSASPKFSRTKIAGFGESGRVLGRPKFHGESSVPSLKNISHFEQGIPSHSDSERHFTATRCEFHLLLGEMKPLISQLLTFTCLDVARKERHLAIRCDPRL
ncbi:hypothetical protein, partial [Microcystis aeruginosa]|uniref:hypothetical protein n=1 Tax=Microcystis aeruginosa TaxID=1126 RepID=UPI001C402ECA